MSYVLTLMGDNISQTAEALADQHKCELRWLDEDKACDLFPLGEAVKPNLPESMNGDFACQPIAGRRKKLLVSDMDSTLVLEETIDLLAALGGVEREVAALTQRAMEGEMDFAQALTQRVSLLKGISLEKISRLHKKITLRAGAETLASTMKANGGSCFLVSGGFEMLVAPTAARAGFEPAPCNRLEVKDNSLTGRLLSPLYDGAAKKTFLLKCAADLNLTETLAVGDGANDIEMLQAASLGVCWGNKKALVPHAQVQIQHSDLTALLFIQGYTRAEFV